ncbi:hypothetical protein [Pseudomonas chlororaphis]|nr:hypothetical protein [Pseudomonas chlororaphis]
MSSKTTAALLSLRACVEDAPAGIYKDAKASGKTIDAIHPDFEV